MTMAWQWELRDDGHLVTVTDPAGERAGERRDPTRWEWSGRLPRGPILDVMAERADKHRRAGLEAAARENFETALYELASWTAVVQAMAAEDIKRASTRRQGGG